VIRNLLPRRPAGTDPGDAAGIGISIEADTAVTIGIAVSVAPGAGTALIANNVITDTVRGAIVGMSGSNAVTGDLSRSGAERYAHITLSGNRVQ
jgi:hypothetical protein